MASISGSNDQHQSNNNNSYFRSRHNQNQQHGRSSSSNLHQQRSFGGGGESSFYRPNNNHLALRNNNINCGGNTMSRNAALKAANNCATATLPPSLLPAAITSYFYSNKPTVCSSQTNNNVAVGDLETPASAAAVLHQKSAAGRHLVRVQNLDLALSEREWRRIIVDTLADYAGIYLKHGDLVFYVKSRLLEAEISVRSGREARQIVRVLNTNPSIHQHASSANRNQSNNTAGAGDETPSSVRLRPHAEIVVLVGAGDHRSGGGSHRQNSQSDHGTTARRRRNSSSDLLVKTSSSSVVDPNKHGSASRAPRRRSIDNNQNQSGQNNQNNSVVSSCLSTSSRSNDDGASSRSSSRSSASSRPGSSTCSSPAPAAGSPVSPKKRHDAPKHHHNEDQAPPSNNSSSGQQGDQQQQQQIQQNRQLRSKNNSTSDGRVSRQRLSSWNNGNNSNNFAAIYCLRHCPPGSGAMFSSCNDELPFVRISLRTLASQLLRLVPSHNGRLPLASLPACLAVESGFQLRFAPSIGCHLEQLIGAIDDVEIVCCQCASNNNQQQQQQQGYSRHNQHHRVKFLTIRNANSRNSSTNSAAGTSNSGSGKMAPAGGAQRQDGVTGTAGEPNNFGPLDKFWCHVDELLSREACCLLPLNDLCARLATVMVNDANATGQHSQHSQQNHVRNQILRQLRCSPSASMLVPGQEAGATNNAATNLLSSPVKYRTPVAARVFQLVGFDQLAVTYTPAYNRARFTSALFRILREQPDGRLPVSQLSQAYQRILGRPFDPRRYGVCCPDDLVMSSLRPPLFYFNSPDGAYLELTSVSLSLFRDRLQRQLFSLLSTKYRFRCPLACLADEWRQFFGRAPQLSDAGLVDFAEMPKLYPDTFELSEKQSTAYIRLVGDLRLVAYSRFVETTLRQIGGRCRVADVVEQVRLRTGFAIVREDFGVATDDLLCERLGHFTKIVMSNSRSGHHRYHHDNGSNAGPYEPYLVLLDENELQTLVNRLLLLLMDSELASMTICSSAPISTSSSAATLTPGDMSPQHGGHHSQHHQRQQHRQQFELLSSNSPSNQHQDQPGEASSNYHQQPATMTGLIINIAQRLYSAHFGSSLRQNSDLISGGGASSGGDLSVLALCLSKKAQSYVDVSGIGPESIVALKPMQRFARDLRTVLLQQQQQATGSPSRGAGSNSGILLTNLYSTYMRIHNQPIRPHDFNAFNVSQLIGFISHVAYMDGPPSDKSVYLTPDFAVRLGDIPVVMATNRASMPSPPTPVQPPRGTMAPSLVGSHLPSSTPPPVVGRSHRDAGVASKAQPQQGPSSQVTAQGPNNSTSGTNEHWRSIDIDQLTRSSMMMPGAGSNSKTATTNNSSTSSLSSLLAPASTMTDSTSQQQQGRSLMALAGLLLKEQVVCPPRNTALNVPGFGGLSFGPSAGGPSSTANFAPRRLLPSSNVVPDSNKQGQPQQQQQQQNQQQQGRSGLELLRRAQQTSTNNNVNAHVNQQQFSQQSTASISAALSSLVASMSAKQQQDQQESTSTIGTETSSGLISINNNNKKRVSAVRMSAKWNVMNNAGAGDVIVDEQQFATSSIAANSLLLSSSVPNSSSAPILLRQAVGHEDDSIVPNSDGW